MKSQTLHAILSEIQNTFVAQLHIAHHQYISVSICDIELATVDTVLSALKLNHVSGLYTASFCLEDCPILKKSSRFALRSICDRVSSLHQMIHKIITHNDVDTHIVASISQFHNPVKVVNVQYAPGLILLILSRSLSIQSCLICF